eukprot:TRINITY_DN69783_c3_g1_i1.p1 TRINITY_DN69783_c3_g1~~TRINITY_DN69783_c3_g1_i1.p1  ORF type:complete len:128 (+),score=6.38 TRINITY_DN69783_c3_g1_i1:151-534(+)
MLGVTKQVREYRSRASVEWRGRAFHEAVSGGNNSRRVGRMKWRKARRAVLHGAWVCIVLVLLFLYPTHSTIVVVGLLVCLALLVLWIAVFFYNRARHSHSKSVIVHQRILSSTFEEEEEKKKNATST